MNFVNQLKEKNNLPIILFVILMINFLPLCIGNLLTKEVKTTNTITEVVCFIIEVVSLTVFYFINRKSIKISKINMIALFGLILIMGIVQIKNFVQKNFYFFDILNIGCIFVNILLFYIVLFDFKIEENNIKFFLKGICIIGLFAMFWNLFFYYQEILAEFGIFKENFDYSHLGNIKSFFSNRNTVAFFLYLSVIASAILMNLENTKKKYMILIILYVFGIWCTHSKTGFAITILFILLFAVCSREVNIKRKILICSCIVIFGALGFLNILGRFPVKRAETIKNIASSEMSELVISTDRIKRLSGRKRIWYAGFECLNRSLFNYIFGVGRFNSIEVLNFEDRSYGQFHNLYLDILLTGGIVMIVFMGYMFFCIMKKIMKSDLKLNYKIIYINMYITYGMYVLLESIGRFSTESTDALCLIFFIALPLLHANSEKNNLMK